MLPFEGFCIECGVDIPTFEHLTCCPKCNTVTTPCSYASQVTVTINWHELRILTMWAENYQRREHLGRTVYSIAHRLTAQYPELAVKFPLTLAEELGAIAKRYEVAVTDPLLRQDVAEQTGEELRLMIMDPDQ